MTRPPSNTTRRGSTRAISWKSRSRRSGRRAPHRRGLSQSDLIVAPGSGARLESRISLVSGAKSARRRLDALLVERGLVETRNKAQSLIMAGLVWRGDRRLEQPGMALPAETQTEVRGREHPWVSRGGLKLVRALDHFSIDPTGVVALDIGASTGGFTDVLLAHGAVRVYAVDVGYGQLAAKLRADPRVVLLERVNARNLTRTQVPEPIGPVVCDASFIGLEVVLPAPLALAAEHARLVALIKPQFEVGKGKVGKGGVVRDPELQRNVCDRIVAWLDTQTGWRVEGLIESPIVGADGNREFLVYARKTVG